MILISACLLGCACRYDGKSKPHPLAQELARQGLRRHIHRYGDGGLGHGGGTAAAARRPRTGRESAGKPAGRIGQYTIADTFRRRAERRASRDFHKKRRIFYVRFVKNTKND